MSVLERKAEGRLRQKRGLFAMARGFLGTWMRESSHRKRARAWNILYGGWGGVGWGVAWSGFYLAPPLNWSLTFPLPPVWLRPLPGL